MAAPAWEIRNSASLAFTALLMRTVGFKNVTKVSLGALSCISIMATRSARTAQTRQQNLTAAAGIVCFDQQ